MTTVDSDAGTPTAQTEDTVRRMCAAVDARDAETYGSFFSDDAYFRFGNAAPVIGRDAIIEATAGVIRLLPPLHHQINRITQISSQLFCDFTIETTKSDGTFLALPCLTTLVVHEGVVADYRVHMDIAPAFESLAAEGSNSLSDEQIIAIQRETVRSHIDAEDRHAMDEVYDTFVDGADAFFDVVPLATRYRGRDGVEGFYEYMFGAFDLSVTMTRQCHSRGSSAIEVTLVGTHRAEFMGIPATGRRIQFEAAAFFVFDKSRPNKLVCERVYFDAEQVLRQVRGETASTEVIGLLADIQNSGEL